LGHREFAIVMPPLGGRGERIELTQWKNLAEILRTYIRIVCVLELTPKGMIEAAGWRR
jgi:hypothetical protein